MAEVQANEPAPNWSVLSNVNLVLESNWGGVGVDICGRCGALVPVTHQATHDAWHSTILAI